MVLSLGSASAIRLLPNMFWSPCMSKVCQVHTASNFEADADATFKVR
ncbi:unnamed protein product, partial [Arabidopsis halleri]